MPQNPLEILKGLALRNVPKTTPQMEENRDLRATSMQENEPTWKKVGRNAVDALTGFVTGDPFAEGVEDESLGSKLGMLMGAAQGIKRPAAKGLVKGIQGFELPDGKVARPDISGVNRIFEGDQAIEQMKRMESRPISQIHRETGFVPTTAGVEGLSDVSVPIADSLDTNMAAGAPLSGRWDAGVNNAARRTKLSEQDIRQIRQLYETGSPLIELQKLYPDINKQTLGETAKRLNFPRVK